MPRPREVRAGDPLSARGHNRTANAAYTGATPAAGHGLETNITKRGVAVAIRPAAEQLANAIRCKLTSTEAAPLFGVVEVYETAAGYYSDPIGRCRRPTQYGFGWLGILLEGANENEAPAVQTEGRSPVKYTGTVAIGGRLGGAKDSHLAVPDQGGPFIVRELPTAGIALVEITGKRLDSKMVDCDAVDASVSGPYHTIIYVNQTTTEDSPGQHTTA